jgi:O-antigen/teichoic acid export membrane protein
VLGGNVLGSLPPIVDLLLVERWRPEGKWFAWPDFGRYRDSLVFGANRVAAGLLGASRGALNAAILPSTLGFEAIGLMNRAEALFAMSAGRVFSLLSDTVYPILPQVAGDERRFARVARGYSLLMLTLLLAAMGLFACCAPDLSRVLYGMKWATADPLLLPGAVLGLGVGLGTVGGQLLLANGRLKHTFALNLLPRALVLPAFVGVIAFDWSIVTFYWIEALGLIVTGLLGFYWASQSLPKGALSAALPGPILAAGAAGVSALLLGRLLEGASPLIRACTSVGAFVLLWFLALRYLLPALLEEMLDLVPNGARLRAILGMNVTR